MNPIIAWKPKLGRINKWKIASARLRCLLPCQYLQKVGYPCEIFNPKHLENYQLVIFQKLYDQKNLTLAKSLQARGIKLAFDLCDNIFYNPNNLSALNQKIEQLTEMINCVDMVTVSTPELGKIIQEKTNKPYLVIDDTVEQIDCHPIAKIYSEINFQNLKYKIQNQNDPSLKIVWYGNAGSETMPVGIQSLIKIIPELELLHQKTPIRLTIISNSKKLLSKYIKTSSFPIKYYLWNPFTFPSLFQQQDICIIPIEINPYTICKTNNRLVLSLLLGVPVIADLIPSYTEFKDYTLSSDWINNLLIYQKNIELRQQHIQQGQVYIQSKYTPEYTISQWSTLFKKLLPE